MTDKSKRLGLVRFYNNKFIAFNDEASLGSITVRTSVSGSNWIDGNKFDHYHDMNNANTDLKSMVCGDSGTMVVTDGYGGSHVSRDRGVTWKEGWYIFENAGTPFTPQNTCRINGLCYANRKFLAVGSAGTVNHLYTHSDTSKLWIMGSTACASNKYDSYQGSYFSDILYDGSQFIIMGGGIFITSKNGTDWAASPKILTQIFKKVAYYDGVYVALGNGVSKDSLGAHYENTTVSTSLDGKEWKTINLPISFYPMPDDIVYGDGYWVACNRYDLWISKVGDHPTKTAKAIHSALIVNKQSVSMVDVLGRRVTSPKGLYLTNKSGVTTRSLRLR